MKIEFIPSSKEVELIVPPPEPGRTLIPEWYKKLSNFDPNNVEWDRNLVKNKNVKMCMPFLDSYLAGYIQRTWCEIYLDVVNEKELVIHYADNPQIVEVRESISMPISDDYYGAEFVWCQPWIPKTPDGYSCLMTHPFNRFEMPFYTVTGIVDTDKFHHQPFGRMPFYIKKGFRGVIPIGTPMYQIIPFKNDRFESEIKKYDEEFFILKRKDHLKKFWRSYREKFWQKKVYK
jgi:hypothetical protein